MRVTETCWKCRGTGSLPHYAHIADGTCFRCKGVGALTYKTSTAERQAKKVKAADRRDCRYAVAIRALDAGPIAEALAKLPSEHAEIEGSALKRWRTVFRWYRSPAALKNLAAKLEKHGLPGLPKPDYTADPGPAFKLLERWFGEGDYWRQGEATDH